MSTLDLAPATARFVSSSYLTDEALAEVGRWHSTTPSRPLRLLDFLKESVAEELAVMLRELPIWSRLARLYDGDDSAVEVTEEEWEENDRRFERKWIAMPLAKALDDKQMQPRNIRVLQQFLAFSTMNGPLTKWLEAATGVRLAPRGSIEMAAYGRGDSVGLHRDKIGSRVFALNFYLDSGYQIGQGARLGYRNEAGDEYFVDPLFNTLSIIPIEAPAVHWVEPYLGSERGRFTISVGQNRLETV